MRKRWSPFPSRKPGVFVRFLLSYLLVLLMPIVIGANEYIKTEKVLVDDATEQNLQMLKMSQEMADRLFLEVKDTVSALSVDTDVLGLILSVGDTPTPEQLYRFSVMRNQLQRYTGLNKLFYDIHLYFGSSHSVVTSKTSFDLRQSDIRVDGRPYDDWIRDVSKRDNQERFYSVDEVGLDGTGRSLIAYVSPLPAGYQGSVQGAIVVWIEQDDIIGIFRSTIAKNEGFAYIADSRGQILAPALADASARVHPLEITVGSNAGSSFRDIGGKRMLVSYTQSEQTGWSFIAAVPARVVLAKADYIKRMIVDITLITLALGLIAALVMAYRNSKPLAELMETMKEFVSRDNGRRFNVYDVLLSTMRDIIQSNVALHSRVEEQQPLVRTALLEKLLKGDYRSETAVFEALKQAEVTLRGSRCFAVVVRISREESAHAAANGGEPAAERILEPLGLILDGFDSLVSASGDKAEALVTVDGGRAEESLNLLRLRLEEHRSWFTGEHGIMATVGVGRLAESLHEAWRSYNEAIQALYYHVPGEGSFVVWYEHVAQGSNHYYYPISIEQKLIHTVKNGDSEGMEQLIRHIEEQNVVERRLSASTMKHLLAEIRGTVDKLLEQLEYGSDSFPELSAKLEALRLHEGEPQGTALKAALRTICAHMADAKKSKTNKMVDEMMRIIHDRFRDPNFGLAALASHFKWSEPLMSVFFKEQAGENFSDYVEKLRMEHACELLLRTDKSIAEIALETGYNSDKTFRRAFKRVTGVQPTTYRSMPSPRVPG